MYNALSSPANLWGKYGEKVGHLPAIVVWEDLWSTSSAAAQKLLEMGTIDGAITKCLRHLSVVTAINTSKCHHQPKTITFLRAGQKTKPRAKSGLLTIATDWLLKVDLVKQ